jgi:hypothetical protein
MAAFTAGAPRAADQPAWSGPARTAGPAAADRSPAAARTGRTVRSWPLLVLAAPAAAEVWSGWVGIAQKTGFGLVSPLPGIWPSLHLDTAITLPVGVEAYAAYALRAWLDRSVSDRTRRFARWPAICSFALGMAGQVAYHLRRSRGPARAASPEPGRSPEGRWPEGHPTLRTTIWPPRWPSSAARAHAVVMSVLTPAEILIAARRLARARPHLAAVAGIVHPEDLCAVMSSPESTSALTAGTSAAAGSASSSGPRPGPGSCHAARRSPGARSPPRSHCANAAARADPMEPALTGGNTSPLLSAAIVGSGSAASSRSSAHH